MSRTLIPIFLLLLVVGCGQPKINGKVVFSDDKSPVPHGIVIFHEGNRIARGMIQSDGSYVMGSLTQKDGLPVGTYKVSIKETQVNISETSLPIYKNVIDNKYESPDTSGLFLEVKGSQTYDIEVDRFRVGVRSKR